MLALLLVEIALSLPEATAMTQVPVLPTLFTAVPMLQCCLFLACDRVTVERNHLRARSLAEFALLSSLPDGNPLGTGGVQTKVWGAVCGNYLDFLLRF